jgi:uncharacterized membrane protein
MDQIESEALTTTNPKTELSNQERNWGERRGEKKNKTVFKQE